MCVCVYLIDVVEFEVFEKQQQDGRDGLHDDLFVAIDINTEFHALQHCGSAATNTCSNKFYSFTGIVSASHYQQAH